MYEECECFMAQMRENRMDNVGGKNKQQPENRLLGILSRKQNFKISGINVRW